MFEIQDSFRVKGIDLKPDMTGRPKVEENIVQTLASLFGWDGEARRLLTCALNGALHMTTPQVSAIVNVLGVGANDDVTFADQSCTEVLILANASNSGDVWVNVGAAGAVDTGFPLDAGESISFSINNMTELQMRIISDGDKVIIIRTV